MENKMEKEVHEIRHDVKLLVSRTYEMDKKLAVYNTQLEEHMRRTEANEIRLEKLENFKWFFAGLTAIISGVGTVIVMIMRSL